MLYVFALKTSWFRSEPRIAKHVKYKERFSVRVFSTQFIPFVSEASHVFFNFVHM